MILVPVYYGMDTQVISLLYFVSPPVAPPPVTPPVTAPLPQVDGQQPPPANQFVRNSAYDEAFTRFKGLGLQTRDVKARAAEPAPFCPGFHGMGGCNSNCRLNGSHRPLVANEKTSLVTWCERFWVPTG